VAATAAPATHAPPCPRPAACPLCASRPQNVAVPATATDVVMTLGVYMVSRSSFLRYATSSSATSQPILCMGTLKKKDVFK
jgi:hypothetical protein